MSVVVAMLPLFRDMFHGPMLYLNSSKSGAVKQKAGQEFGNTNPRKPLGLMISEGAPREQLP